MHTYEITNTCTCREIDPETGEEREEFSTVCSYPCWEYAVEDFYENTKVLQESNETGWWKVSNLRLWSGEFSGYFPATTTEEILRGMTVNSVWTMRYTAYDDRIEYSLSHHDAPTGSASVLTAVSEEEYEKLDIY
jgi:hypothetical protein